jgi:hypothetical protein
MELAEEGKLKNVDIPPDVAHHISLHMKRVARLTAKRR